MLKSSQKNGNQLVLPWSKSGICSGLFYELSGRRATGEAWKACKRRSARNIFLSLILATAQFSTQWIPKIKFRSLGSHRNQTRGRAFFFVGDQRRQSVFLVFFVFFWPWPLPFLSYLDLASLRPDLEGVIMLGGHCFWALFFGFREPPAPSGVALVPLFVSQPSWLFAVLRLTFLCPVCFPHPLLGALLLSEVQGQEMTPMDIQIFFGLEGVEKELFQCWEARAWGLAWGVTEHINTCHIMYTY